ncbi:DUF7161 family protein [Mycobacterium colombiense]|nr:hypothetical protein [Mycobacterium colombiense]
MKSEHRNGESMTMSGRTADQPAVRHFRYDVTGLPGKRMRLLGELPTRDAGHPQEALIAITQVICFDDTPNVMRDLRLPPLGQPDMVARVGFRQLVLNEDQLC